MRRDGHCRTVPFSLRRTTAPGTTAAGQRGSVLSDGKGTFLLSLNLKSSCPNFADGLIFLYSTLIKNLETGERWKLIFRPCRALFSLGGSPTILGQERGKHKVPLFFPSLFQALLFPPSHNIPDSHFSLLPAAAVVRVIMTSVLRPPLLPFPSSNPPSGIPGKKGGDSVPTTPPLPKMLKSPSSPSLFLFPSPSLKVICYPFVFGVRHPFRPWRIGRRRDDVGSGKGRTKRRRRVDHSFRQECPLSPPLPLSRRRQLQKVEEGDSPN